MPTYLAGHLAAGGSAWQVLECLARLGAVRKVILRHIAARQSTGEVTCKQQLSIGTEPALR